MKRLFPLLILAILFSCTESENPVEITNSMSIVQSVNVQVGETTSTAEDFDETINQDLNVIISNLNDVTDINIDALSYQFNNVTGSSNVVIESATIKINNNTIATLSFVNVNTADTNNTVYEITDQNVLNQLETLFLNNQTVEIKVTGSGISSGGASSFDVDVSIDITATL